MSSKPRFSVWAIKILPIFAERHGRCSPIAYRDCRRIQKTSTGTAATCCPGGYRTRSMLRFVLNLWRRRFRLGHQRFSTRTKGRNLRAWISPESLRRRAFKSAWTAGVELAITFSLSGYGARSSTRTSTSKTTLTFLLLRPDWGNIFIFTTRNGSTNRSTTQRVVHPHEQLSKWRMPADVGGSCFTRDKFGVGPSSKF